MNGRATYVVSAEDWLLMLPTKPSERVEPHLLEWFAGEREALEEEVVALVSNLGWWDERWDDYRPVYWLGLVAHWRSEGAIDGLLRLLGGRRMFGGWVVENALIRIALGSETGRRRVLEGVCGVLKEGAERVGEEDRKRQVRVLGALMSRLGRTEEGVVALRRTMAESRGVRAEAARWLAAVKDLWSWPTICSVVEEEERRRELWEVMTGARTMLDGWVLENSPLSNV